jgi:septal ring factor EnvC (AmiA/AmiB activator)
MKKSLDIKSIFIIVLGVLLLIAIFVGQKNNPSDYQKQIRVLDKDNKKLVSRNDSLKSENIKLDTFIISIENKIKENDVKLSQTQSQLNDLKKKKNETPIYVNSLSANGVANAFSDYLEE